MDASCPECGKQQKGSPPYCDNCGARLPSTDEHAGEGKPSSDTVLVSSKTVGVGKGKATTPLPASFGRYRVLREVGRGAMGVVYLARDDRIGRNVAIKSLHIDENLPEDEQEEIRARFEREAKAAGQLSHTNIVTVYDVGDQDVVPYIAMEYLEGATLTDVASEEPLSIPRATSIIEQVLSALAYAHEHDVVHRDIKPDNVFLQPDGRVKVADFGIARLASSSTMTQVGQVMGTPGYMSPEQVKGEAVGPASDIFSTGVLFYELMTGTAPFTSTSPTSIMYKIVHEEPKPAHLINPGVPANLEAVIAKATEKNVAMRYATASEMKSDLASGATPQVSSQKLAHDGTVLRAMPVDQYVPVPASWPVPGQPAPSKKKLAVIMGIAAAAFVVVAAGVVLGVILLGAGGSAITITSPTGKSVTNPVTVRLDVKNPANVARVEIAVDNEVQKTLDGPPFEAQVDTKAGTHTIMVSAYSKDNRSLGTKTMTVDATAGAVSDQDLTGMITSVSGVSTSDVTNGISYLPQQICDNQEVTCWAAKLTTDPNPTLTFTFNQPVMITAVNAIPGYKKVSDVDRYLQNPKPSQVTLSFDDGSSQLIGFDLAPSAAALGWQNKPLQKPVQTRTVRMTVTGVYPGQNLGGGHTASQDLSISELHFIGHTP